MASASLFFFVLVGVILGCITTQRYQTFNQKLFLVVFSGVLGVICGGVVYGFSGQVALEGAVTFGGGHGVGFIIQALYDRYKAKLNV